MIKLNLKFTQKTIKKLKIDFDDDTLDEDEIFSWHVNYFNYDRKTALLLMNDKTRYQIVLYKITKKDIENLEIIFKQVLAVCLLNDGIDPDIVRTYIEDLGELRIVKTDNRSILGQMKESLFDLDWIFERHPLIEYETNHWISDELNELCIVKFKDDFNPKRRMYRILNEIYEG